MRPLLALPELPALSSAARLRAHLSPGQRKGPRGDFCPGKRLLHAWLLGPRLGSWRCFLFWGAVLTGGHTVFPECAGESLKSEQAEPGGTGRGKCGPEEGVGDGGWDSSLREPVGDPLLRLGPRAGCPSSSQRFCTARCSPHADMLTPALFPGTEWLPLRPFASCRAPVWVPTPQAAPAETGCPVRHATLSLRSPL